MILKENITFIMDNIKYKIVGFDSLNDNVIYINVDNKIKWPQLINIELLEGYFDKGIVGLEEDEIMNIKLYEYNEKYVDRCNFNYEVVSFLLQNNEIFYKETRDKIIKNAMDRYNVGYSTVKRLLCNYLKSGKNKSSLIPNYKNCGAKGKERIRKTNAGNLIIDYNMKEIIRRGINKYYNTSKKNTIKQCYELTMRDYLKVNPNHPIPTLKQYYYWFEKISKYDGRNKLSRRNGERVYQQNTRPLLGSSLDDGISPGEVYQIDSTVMDIYCVSELNRNLIIGRPILYIVVDVYSRIIVGINITIEPFNSYTGAMVALTNAFSDKVSYCKKFGIEINKDDWEIKAIPQKILADRGELISSNIENTITNLGVFICNTSPYRGDMKGIVEQLFNNVNKFIKPFCDGIVENGINKIQRGGTDYRLKANLTLYEVTQIIIKWVLFHNNSYVMEVYECDGITVKNNIPKIPRLLWDYGVKEKKGILRELNENIVKMNLLPHKESTVTEKGFRLNKLYYVSSNKIQNGWFQKARIKGSYKVSVSYDPNDLSEIYYIESDGLSYDVLKLVSYQHQYKRIGEEELGIILEHQKDIYNKTKDEEIKAKMNLYDEIEEIALNAKQNQEKVKNKKIPKSHRLKGIRENLENEREYYRDLEKENDKEIIGELDLFESTLDDEWGDDYE